MKHNANIRKVAYELRGKGFSFAEISSKLHVSKSTASLWTRSIHLTERAESRLLHRSILGRNKAALSLQKKKAAAAIGYQNKAEKVMRKIRFDRNIAKVASALLFWCEGSKSTTYVRFTSSDPSLIKLFLKFFRQAFTLNESKFRALIHLHTYHNENKQKKFWKSVTGIPIQQFHRSYHKPNTGKRKHENYPGCIAVTYYDAKVAKELFWLYNRLIIRGVG